MSIDPQNTDALLARIAEKDPKALGELIAKVHDELRSMAGQFLRHERPGHTIQPTALVNEAFIRLQRQNRVRWRNRSHFLAIAAQEMRRTLLDYARARQRKKRGAGVEVLPITLEIATMGASPVEFMDLEEALTELAREDPRKARVVELSFFGGMTAKEVAEVLGLSSRTVELDWRFARAWLYDRLSDRED